MAEQKQYPTVTLKFRECTTEESRGFPNNSYALEVSSSEGRFLNCFNYSSFLSALEDIARFCIRPDYYSSIPLGTKLEFEITEDIKNKEEVCYKIAQGMIVSHNAWVEIYREGKADKKDLCERLRQLADEHSP